jgi:hypothetical protein
MQLAYPSNRLMVLLTADDCRALARLCREGQLPTRFKLYSHSLEADALTIFRWKMEGKKDFDGAPLQASEQAGLSLEDLLLLIELGLPENHHWRQSYRELAQHLTQNEPNEWDWRGNTTSTP